MEVGLEGQRYSHNMNVTAVISTKDRYHTTLPLTIESIINQTQKPKELIIYDDGEHKDLRNDPLYQNIFSHLQASGIEWRINFGARQGQVLNHQRALSEAKYEFIWRLDDDNVAEPYCLTNLMSKFIDDSVGAVGGLVLDPKNPIKKHPMASSQIKDIYHGINIQWFSDTEETEVDHLYSTFLFRKEAAKHGYTLGLSRVGHREETIFTYEMKRNGWKLWVIPEAVTWHYRFPSGGIRDGQFEMWQYDEGIFANKMKSWGINPTYYKLIVLDCGIGDHYCFKMALPKLREKYNDFVIACCFPEMLEDTGHKLISIADAKMMTDIDRHNIYRYMIDKNWKKTLKEAYEDMYSISL